MQDAHVHGRAGRGNAASAMPKQGGLRSRRHVLRAMSGLLAITATSQTGNLRISADTVAGSEVAPMRPAGAYDVRQYGAQGDGQSDDTLAIQSAINAVPASGGTIWFPTGTYIVTPTTTGGLALKSNIRLVGTGASSVLKIKSGIGDWNQLLAPWPRGTAVCNVMIEDLAFDANIANNPTAAIRADSEGTYQTFIGVEAGGNIHIRRCRFAPCSGVWTISLNGETVRDCSVEDCFFRFVMRDDRPDYDNSMVYIEGGHYILSGNRFETAIIPGRGGRGCMEAHGGSAQIFGNTSVGFQTGINIVGSFFDGGSAGNITCHDNTFTDALQAVLLWPTTPNGLENVTVSGNTIILAQVKHGNVDTSGIAVLFDPDATALASNVVITNNAIRFEAEDAGRTGDFYYNSAGIALHNLGGVAGCMVHGNTIELAPSSGIVIGLSEPGQRLYRDIHITDNRITDPGQNVGFPDQFRAGILVEWSATNLTIAGNSITDTFVPSRCATAISFDLSLPNVFQGIAVQKNTITAARGTLPVVLPS